MTNQSKDVFNEIVELTETGEDTTDVKDEEPKHPPKPQKNPRFRDVEETGRWGELRRNEIYGVIIFGILVVVSICFWTSFSTTKKLELSHERIKLNSVLHILQERNHTLIEMPSDISFYENVIDDGSSPAYHRAIKWLLSDNYVRGEFFLRFVLSSLYFDLGGEAWDNSTNWLTNASTCDWFGLECAIGNGHLQSLNLANNNLTGTIPEDIAILENVSNIWLSDNELHGTIPGEAFSKLSKLAVLFLDNNKLSGTVPAELGDISNLGKWMYHNGTAEIQKLFLFENCHDWFLTFTFFRHCRSSLRPPKRLAWKMAFLPFGEQRDQKV